MGLNRLILLVLMALVPLAAVREIWWSELLFAKPWKAAGGGTADFGVFNSLLVSPFAVLMTLVAGFFVGLLLDVIANFFGRTMIPFLGCSALVTSTFVVARMTDLTWAAIWPLFGFLLIALIWIHGCLRWSRRYLS